MKKYGFAVEPNRRWSVTPATQEDGIVTCHDISGFMGSWKMNEGGRFFECPDGDILNQATLEEAQSFGRERNSSLPKPYKVFEYGDLNEILKDLTKE